MHRVLSTERSHRDAPGHYGAETPRYGCAAEPYQTADQGGFSPSPGETARRLGHCSEPASRSCHSPVSRSGTGTSAPFSRRVTNCIGRGAAYGLRLLLLGLIRFYHVCLSPITPSSCRYYPSCSAYAYEAVEKWGAWEGSRLTICRLLRCRPWGGHGYDPVP